MSKILVPIVILMLAQMACKDKNAENIKEPIVRQPVEVAMDTLLTGLTQPWGMAFLPDGRILIAEKSGTLLAFQNGSRTTISGMPAVRAVGQGGFMDIALHPNYASNGWIYFSATADSGNVFSTALFRAKINGNALQEVQKLFQSNQLITDGAHFGSRIVFDRDNYVYLCLGERNQRNLSQNLGSHAGKVIRLHDDGRIPADNPYVSTPGAAPQVWTYGHRNPQGMVRHPLTGTIWLHEHGPLGGDEINILEKGANYGWPLATFGINYNGQIISRDTALDGTIQPVFYWNPSIAPCGMDFYFSDSIPQWNGRLFLGALAGRHLNMLEISGERVVKETRLLEGYARFRCVKQGPDGYLYFLTEAPGVFARFRPAAQ